ncbi:unnamed protein product [Prorocentrum cordatum]|uniref:Uncharacterized protein n=1 Tax=Prorocentrum cordatum TaxID=2364126 RepID=A0ABN9VPL9_9DINO|nr:unnamed protein product [Polarella glacialis]
MFASSGTQLPHKPIASIFWRLHLTDPPNDISHALLLLWPFPKYEQNGYGDGSGNDNHDKSSCRLLSAALKEKRAQTHAGALSHACMPAHRFANACSPGVPR